MWLDRKGAEDVPHCLGSTSSISLQIEQIDTLSGDHAILPNNPIKRNAAAFGNRMKFGWFHSLSGCALVWSFLTSHQNGIK